MSRFLCQLDIRLMLDDYGNRLESRSGRQLWQLLAQLSYQSNVAKIVITVPAGFVTDLASVPRLPFIYAALGDEFQMPAVIHDYLYSTHLTTRELADKVLDEAMKVQGYSWIKRKAVIAGVRIGGGLAYKAD